MDKASATLETVVGRVVVFDVCFIRGTKASHTLYVAADNGVQVYVDVDAECSPVAVTLIHGLDIPIRYVRVPDDGDEPLYEDFAVLAARIVELDKEGALPKRFVMRQGKPVAAIAAPPRADLPMPETVRWRPD